MTLAAGETDENKHDTGSEKANGGEPFTVGAIGLKQVLAAGAGKAPADGCNNGEQNVLELHGDESPFLLKWKS